ncbi:hypothetical protein E2C01_087302 [Portunus trituberculatus]|uniref:Uncharacterized protein n=1 Tax=Portunus trituberculatus TaxID=210409 RepID=A0A5B7JC43_PORTR|nr:hypothetical protein [Portunus trituberculatus]
MQTSQLSVASRPHSNRDTFSRFPPRLTHENLYLLIPAPLFPSSLCLASPSQPLSAQPRSPQPENMGCLLGIRNNIKRIIITSSCVFWPEGERRMAERGTEGRCEARRRTKRSRRIKDEEEEEEEEEEEKEGKVDENYQLLWC